MLFRSAGLSFSGAIDLAEEFGFIDADVADVVGFADDFF